jgi:choline dehydrogenase-like flavoprotein
MKLITCSYPHIGVFIGISRDHPSEKNTITLDKEGNPLIHYELSDLDQKGILAGVEQNIRLQYEAGALFILLGHSNGQWFYTKQFSTKQENDNALEKYIQEICWKEGIIPNKLTLFSAHQMSSCRMSSSVNDGPTSITGELYECENCFIADGSVLPTSLGINPMITIEAYSHMISKHVIKKLASY